MKNDAFLLVLNLLVKHITMSRNNYPDDKTNLVNKYVVKKLKISLWKNSSAFCLSITNPIISDINIQILASISSAHIM